MIYIFKTIFFQSTMHMKITLKLLGQRKFFRKVLTVTLSKSASRTSNYQCNAI